MSTPRGKPPNPIALSTHVSHKAHEEAVTEPPRSPYAPKQAYQRAGTERYPVENDRDPIRSPYAPKQARTQGAASDSVAGDDSGRLPRTRRGSCEHIARYDVGSHEAVHPSAEHHDPGKRDHDLEQLEASLRLLQRQESATRSPRATHMAPVPGPARRQRGERLGDRFRSLRPLERERLQPEMPRRNIGAGRQCARDHLVGDNRVLLCGGGGGLPRQNLRLGRKRHPIRPSSPRHRPGPRANKRPRRRWLKTIILRRRRRPPRASRRRSQRDAPQARPVRLCNRMSLVLRFRLRAKPPVCLIRKRLRFS